MRLWRKNAEIKGVQRYHHEASILAAAVVKRHISGQSDIEQSEEIKSLALAVLVSK